MSTSRQNLLVQYIIFFATVIASVDLKSSLAMIAVNLVASFWYYRKTKKGDEEYRLAYIVHCSIYLLIAVANAILLIARH